MRPAAALVILTACSYSYSRPPITAQTKNPSCRAVRPAIDTAAAVSLGTAGGLVGLYGIAEEENAPVMLGVALLVGSALFAVSAGHGFSDGERCERELLATFAAPPPPLHVEEPAVALTCEQRRLDMYSRAVTGADATQRVKLLTTLPACEEGTSRERAWTLTRLAALDASAGKCEDIESIARQVYELDIVLHDVVLMGDIEIKHCLMNVRREL